MSLIRSGLGSDLYIYEDVKGGYTCCSCPITNGFVNVDTREQLKAHVLIHKDHGHSIGLVGNPTTYQSYDQLIQAIDADDF
jgi:hypothetical protein